MDFSNPSHRYRWYARGTAAAVLVVVAVELLERYYNVPVFGSFLSLFHGRMKFNSALGFLLGALSLFILSLGNERQTPPRLAALLPLALILLGAFSVGQYLGSDLLRIDMLPVGELDFSDNGPFAHRMAVLTGLAFISAGCALLLLHLQHPPSLAFYIAAGTGLVWIGVAVAFLYGLSALYSSDRYGGISVPTTACFILLSSGILFARPHLGPMSLFANKGFSGIVARRMFPAALFIPILFGWLLLRAEDIGLVDLPVGAAIQALSIFVLFVALIVWSACSVLHLEAQVSREQHDKTLALETAAHLARYDVLTQLPNRALLQERLTEAIKLARRRHVRTALLFLDLDRFKPINDTYGHQTGDQVLIEVGKRLVACVRETDMVSRQGGDEFVILLQDVTHVSAVSHVASHILAAITRPYLMHGQELFLSGSIGISMFPDDGDSAQTLTEHADAAMYHAKSLGRANFQYFTSDINEQAVRRAAVERQIRAALADEGFVLHYQPKIHAHTGELRGLEALARFRNADIPPSEFIPTAEESNLIGQLGEWVLREACRQNRAWQDAGCMHVPVSVNVSPVQFRSRSFLPVVKAALRDSGLDPAYLDIEVTESTAMDDFDYSIATMKALQKLGVSMSIDDFGTGHSSLSYLKRFPINALKIDRSFIQDVTFNSDDAAITCAIINMAKNLKQEVIAEGVETSEQYDFLREQGCDQVQGFYFSEALAPEVFARSSFWRTADEAVPGAREPARAAGRERR